MDYKQLREAKVKSLIPQPVTQGAGLVNSCINKLPFEAHLPGYNYAGPGTNLELRLEKGDKPINKLDEAAMYHDIAYSKSNDLKDRHAADKVLQEAAWNRVLAKDSGFGEKANAWLVTNAMKAKRWSGSGISNYYKQEVTLDEKQILKITNAKNGVKLNLRWDQLIPTKDNIMNGSVIYVTPDQLKKIKHTISTKKSVTITLSQKQISFMKKNGGFLPGLLAAIPAMAAVGSMGAQIYSAYNNKKTNDRLIDEKIRHNKATEGKGIYLNKKPKMAGKGVYLNKKPRPLKGNGLLKQLIKKKPLL